MSFGIDRLRNMCACKCQNRHVSACPRTVNILKCSQNRCNLHDSSFIKFINHSGKIRLGKGLS